MCAAEEVIAMRPNDIVIPATFGVMAILLAAVLVANGIFLASAESSRVDVVEAVLSPDRQLTASIVRVQPRDDGANFQDNIIIHRAGEDPTRLTDGARSVFDRPIEGNELGAVRWLDAVTLEIHLGDRKRPPEGLKESVGPVRIVVEQ